MTAMDDLKVIYADASYEEYGYDAASNVTSFRNRAGEVISFGYDALNRLEWKQLPNDPNIVLLYDIAGRCGCVTGHRADVVCV